MGIINKIKGFFNLPEQIKAIQSTVSLQQYTTLAQNIFPTWQAFKDLETYRIIDDVYSVVKKLARTAAMIPFYGYDLEGEDLSENHPLTRFLKTLTYKEKVKLYTFLFLAGECFLWKEVIEFGVNRGLKKVHFLTPNNITVVKSDGFPELVVGYKYKDDVRQIKIDWIEPTEMIHVYDFDPQNPFRGLSPIFALAKTLTRLKAGKDISVKQLQNGGVSGIVTAKDSNFDAVEKVGMRQEKFTRYARNSDNIGLPYFAGGDLKYLAIGLNLTDLNVAELASIDFDKICNAYGISSILFNDKSAATESNVKQMVQSMYTNAVMPSVIMVRDAFNTELLEYPNVTVDYDVSDISELSDDYQAKAEMFSSMPTIIPNEVREAFGYDKDPDPLMDLSYIKTGYQPITDFQQVDPL